MLSIEHKCYQLIISRLDGANISDTSYMERCAELVRKGIGGFIIFGGEKVGIKKCIQDLQSLSAIPLFIASDIERGVGQQIDGATMFPGQMALAAASDMRDFDRVKVLGDVISAVAHEAIDIGINMPLIPVLDVNKNPDNPIICTRAFSDDPEVVAWYGKMHIRTLEKTGLISCAKHFPGHGDTAVDSHMSLPVISKSFMELNDTDLFPFIEAIKTGVSSIMTGHISVPAIDDLPASLSKKVITDLLRIEIGYEGLILTDALNMKALDQFDRVPSRCIEAGVDILLHPADADEAVEELKSSIASGELNEERIDTAVQRIMKYKSGISSIIPHEINYCKHAVLSTFISDATITLLQGKPGLLPVRDVQNAPLLFAADENRHDLTCLKDATTCCLSLKDYRGDVPQGTLIIALFTSIAAWAGTSGIGHEDINIIRDIIKKSRNSIVISFGSPYVLRHFPEADALIAAYDTTPLAQSSALKCLSGEADFKGRLPVTF